MIGIKQKLRYSEMYAARTYLKELIAEIENKNNSRNTNELIEKELEILEDMLISLDELFIKQISFIENEIDINHPAI